MLVWLLIQNIIPEAIAITISLILNGGLLFLVYSVAIRLIWQSAIIVHGLGHTMAIALADGELSAINLTNILEHQSIADILRSLLPCHPIFIPAISPSPQPYLTLGKPHHIKTKALGGIVLNLLVAVCFNYSHSWFAQALVIANLLIAFASLSDVEAFITGVADYFYCGNFGLIAQRQPDDGDKLLPDRLRTIALQMGQETEVRGEQAGGGLVIGKHDSSTVFVGKKIVNRKRANLTQSLEAAFAPIRHQAIAAGVKPLESSTIGVWHYRYATSGTAPSVIETHWHEWMNARNQAVWQFTGREWICETKNVHHRITHNGDFDSWEIFNRQIDHVTLGLWLERVLHTPNATKGDSPKIAGMIDLLVTQGRWYPSVRLAYQWGIATAIEDAFGGSQPTKDATNIAPSEDDLNTWAEICDRVFTEELASLKRSNSSKLDPASLKFSKSLQQNLIRALKNHNSTLGWSQLHLTTFVQFALLTFFDNDLYRATQIFISRAQGSFGLVTTSTLEAAELVLCAKGQPITIGFNWSENYMVYASEPAAVDRILLDRQESFRLDLDGIATIEVHSANPQDNLLHIFGHRIVRGTLIWLGIPDGRRSPRQQKAENAVIITGKQANGVRNFNIGAEITAIGNNPKMGDLDFSKALILNSNNDDIYYRNSAVAEQKEQIEELRESCFGAFERLLASYVFFWALAKKVASFPFLKYEYWKSQSRTKVMTTASPVAGFNLDKLTNRNKSVELRNVE